MTTVKSVTTKSFELILTEADNGRYYISYQRVSQQPVYSEPIVDLPTATYIFDKKLTALEGH